MPRIYHKSGSHQSLHSLTNDGNAILREIDIAHPAVKNMIELSRTQDKECRDGTTSIIILGLYLFFLLNATYSCSIVAGEILAQSLSQLKCDIHPVVIISAYNKALKEALEIIKRISVPVNINNDKEMLALIKMSIGTKFVARWSDLMCKLALQAVQTVTQDQDGMKTVDINMPG